MKYVIILLLSFSCFFFSIATQAKLNFEPYASVGASYSTVSNKENFPVFWSLDLGLKTAYQISLFNAGLDLFWTHYSTGRSLSSHHLEIFPASASRKGFSQAEQSVSLYYSSEPNHFQPLSLGPFVSIGLPLFFDVYGSVFYSFGEQGQLAHQGYGIKAGASYISTFLIQLNLELKWASYFCSDSDNDCADRENFSLFSILLSLSVPFSTDIFDFSSADSDSIEEEDNASEIENAIEESAGSVINEDI